MPRSVRLLIAVAVVAASCTNRSAHPRPSPSTGATGAVGASSPGRPSLRLDVVAAVSGSGAAGDTTYVQGMQLAVQQLNAAGGVGGKELAIAVHDDQGEMSQATSMVGQALDRGPAAILYVGPGPALLPLRQRFQQLGVPVILVEGDLYSSRALFPQAFQASIPWAWQAHVIARYLVRDRGARRIAFAGIGPEAAQAESATRSELRYWGGNLAAAATAAAGSSLQGVTRAVAGADAVIGFGSPSDSLRLAQVLTAASPVPRLAFSEAIFAATAGRDALLPGAVACYPYTWDGWAEPIRRARNFRTAFEMAFGQAWGGLGQEGYDAVRLLADGLRTTGGRGGSALVRALEATHARTYSSFPIDLGPDDHVLMPRDELGLFAVPGPMERLDPWQAALGEFWRPIMRTFTYDGRRDDILDMDKPAFFPSWGKDQPGPFYWRSRYGIVTRPRDPVH